MIPYDAKNILVGILVLIARCGRELRPANLVDGQVFVFLCSRRGTEKVRPALGSHHNHLMPILLP